MSYRDRYASPEKGLPFVESVCDNGHRFAGELAWKLPMVFPEVISLTAACPECSMPLAVKAGSYERNPETGVYVRTGPADSEVVVPIG
jgi:hypothetical protein